MNIDTSTASLVADIRNKLGPFWNLVAIIRSGNYTETDIKNEAEAAFNNQQQILSNLDVIIENAESEIFFDDWARYYGTPVEPGDLLIPADEFFRLVAGGSIMDDDGFGYWVKDGKKCQYDVFSSVQEDATHVVWYNK
jgi:hypothetical protein